MPADTPTIVFVHGAWADATGFGGSIRALRSGERAPSATADSHTAPEVKKWLAHKDPAPLAFALHPDLQLMAQPDRALFKELKINGSAVACSPVSPTSPRRSPSGPNTGTPTRSRSYGKPPRNRSSQVDADVKSDADVKPSTGLKLRRTEAAWLHQGRTKASAWRAGSAR